MLRELVAVAKEAGRLIPDAHDALHGFELKGAKGNYVTEFDKKIQELIFEKLKKLDPGAEFMGEENGQDVFRGADRLFVVDPIDGTANFIRGHKHSCVSIALLCGGAPRAGVIYDPFLDEAYYAESGKGAFLNGKPMHVADNPTEDCIVAFGSSPYYPELWDATFDTVKALMSTVSDVRRCGSAALDLAFTAAGRNDLFFELRLSPWDFAAGAILITEAGGVFTTDMNESADFSKKACIVAGSRKCFEHFKKIAKF